MYVGSLGVGWEFGNEKGRHESLQGGAGVGVGVRERMYERRLYSPSTYADDEQMGSGMRMGTCLGGYTTWLPSIMNHSYWERTRGSRGQLILVKVEVGARLFDAA